MMRLAVLGALALLLGAALPSSALGAWSRARLMSATAAEQALTPPGLGESSAAMGPPAISGDGRYVVFGTRSLNLITGPDSEALRAAASQGGVLLRRAVDDGALDVVAIGALPALTVAPQVSSDGRYVAFTSTQPLSAADTDGGGVDVYVRDLDAARLSPGAYLLISPPGDGAQEHELLAMSADGGRVLYRETPGAEPDTKPLVVFDRATNRALPVASSTLGGDLGAATMSADGSTIAWLDAEPALHVDPSQFLLGELPFGRGPADLHTDLLWQRLGGSAARRVTGTGDSEDPGCPPGVALAPDFTTAVPEGVRSPCDGPFSQAGVISGVPTSTEPAAAGFSQLSISGDGGRVAWATARPRRTGGFDFADLFVRNMLSPGGRKATTTEITRFSVPRSALIGKGAALSGDGRSLAFATEGRSSLLASPTLLTPSAAGDVAATEVYVANLDAGIIERVSRSFAGLPTSVSSGSAAVSSGPVISADGSRVAFLSTADNLIFGDGNGLADIFVADRFADEQPPLVEQTVASTAAGGVATPSWRMSVTVSRGGGTLYVDARVPVAGTVRVTARTRSRIGKRRTKPIVAQGSAQTGRPLTTRVRARLRATYAKRAQARVGLPVSLVVTFTPTGARKVALTRTVTSVFRVKKPTAKPRSATSKRRIASRTTTPRRPAR